LIEQGAREEAYLRIYSEKTYRIISLFHLHDIFHAPYFYAALSLFFINLLLCTLRMYRRTKEASQVRVPSSEELLRMEGFSLKGRFDEALAFLSRRYRRIASDKSCVVFEKGRLSRYGLLLLHLSILLILLGSLLGLILGTRGSVLLKKGEETDMIALRGKAGKAVRLPFTIRCRDFTISFYPEGEPKEYRSSLEIMEEGKTVLVEDAVVNKPVHYRGYYIYQATYEKEPVFSFSVNGRKVEVREGEPYKGDRIAFMVVRYEKSIHDFGEGVLLAYLEGNETKTVWLLRNLPEKRTVLLGKDRIEIEDIKEELMTGLEVSKDPGIPLVWTGFSTLLLGLLFNILFYERRIFLRKEGDEVLIGGFARRHKDAFSRELERLKEVIRATAP